MNGNKYTEKYNELARSILNYMAENNRGENIIVSPLSFILLLGIAADTVQGKAREEVLRAVGDNMSFEDFLDVLKEIQTDSAKSGSLKSSNAVCIKESISDSVSEEYVRHLSEVFDGRSFSSSDMVRDVNAWIKEKTNGMIENVADESMKQMLVCLMNAIAFESEWKEKYEERDVYFNHFHNSDGSLSKVQMLSSTEKMYIADEFFTGFVKPYKDEKYSYMALLPRKEGNAFLQKTVKQINFTKLLSEVNNNKVFVRIPEYRYEYGKDLTGLCHNMGINTLFTTEADFSPLSSESLMMGSIVYKAHIEVDRKGTKAAVDSMGIVLGDIGSIFNREIVILNRPFVYAIMDTETKLPVFTGIYNRANV